MSYIAGRLLAVFRYENLRDCVLHYCYAVAVIDAVVDAIVDAVVDAVEEYLNIAKSNPYICQSMKQQAPETY